MGEWIIWLSLQPANRKLFISQPIDKTLNIPRDPGHIPTCKMKVWLSLFALLVAISCASQFGGDFSKKRARKYEDRVGANKAIRLIEADNNPSKNEYIEKLGTELVQFDLKKNSSEAYNRYERIMKKVSLERDENRNYIHNYINPGANDNEAIRDAAVRGHDGVLRLLLEKDKYGN